ncbi:hypothetical protein ES703_87851 [subsurface metagenome]
MNGNNERPVACPRNPIWLEKMLAILPVGLRGKLQPFAGCIEAEKPKVAAKVVRPVVKR